MVNFSDNTAMSWLKFNSPKCGISVVILLAWAVAISVPITLLMAGHVLPLPMISSLQSTNMFMLANGSWQAVHILKADCPCSESVSKYLLKRGPQKDLNEQIWMMGENATWETSLKQSGFVVQHHDAEQVAAQLGVQGGPWLLIISPKGEVAYSGGYAPQRPGPSTVICDLALWQAVSHGHTVQAYPAYGCAASCWLRKTIDPLGMKYAGELKDSPKNEKIVSKRLS